MAVDLIMKSSLVRKTLDNITVLFVAFENFQNYVNFREHDFFKKENLRTEISQSKNLSNNKKDNPMSSSTRVNTDNIHSINVDKIFNSPQKNKNKNLSSTNNGKKEGVIKNTHTNFNKKDNYMIFNTKPYLDENVKDEKFDKMKLEKLKTDSNQNNANYKLPPVLNTETNFRQSDNKRINYFKNMFNGDESRKNSNRLSLNDFKDSTNKLPIKVISLDNKNSQMKNIEDHSEDEDSNKFSINHFDEKYESDFKSKYNHENMVKKFEEQLNSKKLHTEI